MADLIEFPLDEGGSIIIAVNNDNRGPRNVAFNDTSTAKKVTETLEASLGIVKPAAKAIRAALKDLAPGETELKFGVTFSVRTGIPILSAATEGTFEITLRWTGTSPDANGQQSVHNTYPTSQARNHGR